MVGTAFWLALFLWLTISFISINRTAQALLPDALEYGDAYGARLQFSELYAAQAKVEGLQVSGESSARGLVYAADFPRFEGIVRIVRTDGNYPAFHSLKLLRGAFFPTEPAGREPAAVISEPLAVQAFKSVDVIGNLLEVGGQLCRVVGVYEPDDSLLYRYSSDGQDVVYIPYYVEAEGTTDQVETFYLREIGRDTGVSYLLLSQWDDATGGKSTYYQQADYFDRAKLAEQALPTLFFLMGMVLTVYIIRYLYRAILHLIGFWQEKRAGHELVSVREWVYAWLPAAVSVCALIVVLLLVGFEPFMPAGFLPDSGNIFEFSHYVEIVLSAANRRNLSSAYLFYDNYTFHLLWLNGVFLVACTAGFIGLCSSVKKLVSQWK